MTDYSKGDPIGSGHQTAFLCRWCGAEQGYQHWPNCEEEKARPGKSGKVRKSQSLYRQWRVDRKNPKHAA